MNELWFKALCMTHGAKDDAAKFKLALDSVDKMEKIKGAVKIASGLLSAVPASDSKTELEANMKEFAAMDSIEDTDLISIRDFIRDTGVALLSKEPAKDAAPEKKPEDKAPEKKPEPASDADPKKELAALIGDAVAQGVAAAFKAAGLVKDADEDVKDEFPKKDDKDDKDKKNCGDSTTVLTTKSSTNDAAKGGFTIDSITDTLLGRTPKEGK